MKSGGNGGGVLKENNPSAVLLILLGATLNLAAEDSKIDRGKRVTRRGNIASCHQASFTQLLRPPSEREGDEEEEGGHRPPPFRKVTVLSSPLLPRERERKAQLNER